MVGGKIRQLQYIIHHHHHFDIVSLSRHFQHITHPACIVLRRFQLIDHPACIAEWPIRCMKCQPMHTVQAIPVLWTKQCSVGACCDCGLDHWCAQGVRFPILSVSLIWTSSWDRGWPMRRSLDLRRGVEPEVWDLKSAMPSAWVLESAVPSKGTGW